MAPTMLSTPEKETMEVIDMEMDEIQPPAYDDVVGNPPSYEETRKSQENYDRSRST